MANYNVTTRKADTFPGEQDNWVYFVGDVYYQQGMHRSESEAMSAGLQKAKELKKSDKKYKR